MKVVIAEDERDTRQLLTLYFEGKGHRVIATGDGATALQAINRENPDLLLLDVRMPVLDGWSVLNAVRSLDRVLPIVMLTALDSVQDAVRGLNLGADDYLRKPFDLDELEARIESVLRRKGTGANDLVLRVGALTIDDREKKVTVDGKHIELSPREYHLLQLLASEPGRVFSNEEIMHHVWGRRSRADKNDVKQYIHLLRKKIDVDSKKSVGLETVPGFGYRIAV